MHLRVKNVLKRTLTKQIFLTKPSQKFFELFLYFRAHNYCLRLCCAMLSAHARVCTQVYTRARKHSAIDTKAPNRRVRLIARGSRGLEDLIGWFPSREQHNATQLVGNRHYSIDTTKLGDIYTPTLKCPSTRANLVYRRPSVCHALTIVNTNFAKRRNEEKAFRVTAVHGAVVKSWIPSGWCVLEV